MRWGLVMIYLYSIIAGAVGALIGWALGSLGGLALVNAFGSTLGLSNAGTSSGTLAFFGIGPLGAVLGLALAIGLTLRFRGGYRKPRDLMRHGLAVAALIGAIIAGAINLNIGTASHLGFASTKPAVEFEIRLPQQVIAQAARSEVQVELHTDKNQTLATLNDKWRTADDGRPVLTGQVALNFETRNRLVVLSLPGQPQRLFRRRLEANPSASDAFSPWHQVDFIDKPGTTPERAAPTEGFAIRYRVL